jgi:Spy/CpxP family protein refolding chaperone
VEHHRQHHQGGVMSFIEMSLDTLGVSPEQHAALEKIQADLQAHLKPAQAADARFLAALADGIAAGAIDKAKADAAVGAMEAASANAHSASVAALNQLHAVLTPEQRGALVDKVRAHWEVWQQANAVEGEPAEAPKRGRVDALTQDLDLTADQVAKIRASLTSTKHVKHFDPAKVEAHLRAFETSFAGNTFDAKSLPAGKDANAAMTGWAAERTARFFEVVAPVITPEQRTKLAGHLRAHAKSNATD